jgi:AraC-like DNA-binding protein
VLLRPLPGSAAWPAALIVWGPGFTSTAHRHHCVQLVMALSGSLLVRGGPHEAWRKCDAVLVQPDVRHEVDARGSTVLIGFIDAESEMGAALSKRIKGDIACVPARQVARWCAALGPSPNEARAERWLTTFLSHRKRVVVIHPGVQRVLSHLRKQQALSNDLSLKALAALAGLSPSRFMHVFTESVGIPVRPHVLWLRVQRAACDLMGGASVTSAAHRAGFSDGAHLTRTFRRMLGATPSDLALRNKRSQGLSIESTERQRTEEEESGSAQVAVLDERSSRNRL